MSEQTDNVDRYGGDACMVLMEEAGMGRHCCLTNIIMYFYRLGLKDDGHTPREQSVLRDMRKAKWYLDRYMASDYGGPLTTVELKAILEACELGVTRTQRTFADADLPPREISEAVILANALIETLEGLGTTEVAHQATATLPEGVYAFLIKIANENFPHGLAMDVSTHPGEPDLFDITNLKYNERIASLTSRQDAELLVDIVTGS